MATDSRASAYIDEYGIHVPSYPDVLADLQNEFRAIYGQDVYLEPDSQDGQLCAVFALRIYDCYALAASVYNAYSPHSAQGVGLSSVVKTNGIRRQVASFSHAQLRLIGQAGTVISHGIATDEGGQRWLLPEDVIIPLEGEITVTALAEKEGELRAAPGEIKNIATPTRGWQAVTNPQAAEPGAPVEKDSTLRQRQSISTALPSLSIFDGTAGAVASLPGVSRSRGYENDTSITDANGLPPHSISFVVEGGDTQSIGDIIATKKGPGCGTHGDVNVHTRDQKGCPLTVRFFRPAIISLALAIRIKPLPGYLSITGEKIRASLVEYLNTLRIGDDILLSKLYTPINAAEPVTGQRTFDVVSLAVGVRGETAAPVNFPVPFNAAVACRVDDIDLKEYEDKR